MPKKINLDWCEFSLAQNASQISALIYKEFFISNIGFTKALVQSESNSGTTHCYFLALKMLMIDRQSVGFF